MKFNCRDLLYAPRDSITILLYNLKTKNKVLLKRKLFQNTLGNMSFHRHKVIPNYPVYITSKKQNFEILIK